MQQHGSKYFAHAPPLIPDPGGWGKIQLNQIRVIFHIKLNGISNAGKW